MHFMSHPSIFFSKFRVVVGLKPVTAVTGQEAQVTSLSRLRQRGRQPFTIIPTNQFKITNSPNMHVFAPGGSQSTGKESQQAWAEHVISTHQRQPEDSNSGPCCCDTVNHCTTGDQASQFGISFKNRAQCDCSCK